MPKPAIRSRPIAAKRPTPVPTPPARSSGKAVTSLHIEPATLVELKKLAADRRCRVNDLVVEAIEKLLDSAAG